MHRGGYITQCEKRKRSSRTIRYEKRERSWGRNIFSLGEYQVVEERDSRAKWCRFASEGIK